MEFLFSDHYFVSFCIRGTTCIVLNCFCLRQSLAEDAAVVGVVVSSGHGVQE